MQSADVSILLNIGNGSFARLPESLPAEIGPQAVIAADLEGDGDLDLIVTNGSSEHLGILRNVSDPVTHEIRFAPLQGFAVGGWDGGPSYSVIAGHFNADEALDLAVAVGEMELRTGQSIPDVPQNYVSVLLNEVFEGAHRVTVTGVEEVPPLDFGVRPAGNLPAVAGRRIFYNQSWYDGDNPAANDDDDNAIAVDKVALLPGQTATFANYASYALGINGIMVDVSDPAGTATVGDFVFKVGNNNDPSTWTLLEGSDLPTVTVRPGKGTGGSDRITLIWTNNIVQKQWLQVTIPAGGNLGLVADEVFYFGNAIGESGDGNPPGVATVFISDELGCRPFFNEYNRITNPAPVDQPYDYNRDAIVFPADELTARDEDNQTNFLTGLKLITVPSASLSSVVVQNAIEATTLADSVRIDPEDEQDDSTPFGEWLAKEDYQLVADLDTAGRVETEEESLLLSVTIDAGNHVLLPDTPNQQIEIHASGGEAVNGVELFLQIADGGPEAGGSIDGPEITGADLRTNTIFAGNNTGQAGSVITPQVAQFGTTTIGDTTVNADGLLATITIDTTGFFATTPGNPWTLMLSPTLAGNSSFPGVITTVVNGTIMLSAKVVARHVFYNNSKWDGHAGFEDGDPAVNEFDDAAIATDKTALLPGETATFANYTSYSRGINGIMVDINGLADPGAVGDGDFSEFTFKVGNSDDLTEWLPRWVS